MCSQMVSQARDRAGGKGSVLASSRDRPVSLEGLGLGINPFALSEHGLRSKLAATAMRLGELASLVQTLQSFSVKFLKSQFPLPRQGSVKP